MTERLLKATLSPNQTNNCLKKKDDKCHLKFGAERVKDFYVGQRSCYGGVFDDNAGIIFFF